MSASAAAAAIEKPLPEVNDAGTGLRDEEFKTPLEYSEWLRVTRNHTVGSRNLMLGARWRFDDLALAFCNAFYQVEAQLNNKPAPKDAEYCFSLPSDEQRRELEKHPEYLPEMRKRLGPRLFDPAAEGALSYAVVLDRAKLYAEREQIGRWLSGYEMKRWYYGESGGRVIIHTEYYINSFVQYVAFATSHALLSPERVKQAEREAALALRNLDTIALPITPELRSVLSDPQLLLTRGCFLGHPQVDTPRYAQFNIGSYPAPQNYKPTAADEREAREAFVAGLEPAELRDEVRSIFAEAQAAAEQRWAKWREEYARFKRERDEKEESEKKKAKTDAASSSE